MSDSLDISIEKKVVEFMGVDSSFIEERERRKKDGPSLDKAAGQAVNGAMQGVANGMQRRTGVNAPPMGGLDGHGGLSY